MTEDEMIAVIKAHRDGKVIQSMPSNRDIDDWTEHKKEEWVDVPNFHPFYFNFYDYNYRIKPESHYRPFKSAEEVMAAIKEHGMFMYCKKYKYYTLLANIHDNCIETSYTSDKWDYSDAMERFEFADGTPFGVKED